MWLERERKRERERGTVSRVSGISIVTRATTESFSGPTLPHTHAQSGWLTTRASCLFVGVMTVIGVDGVNFQLTIFLSAIMAFKNAISAIRIVIMVVRVVISVVRVSQELDKFDVRSILK